AFCAYLGIETDVLAMALAGHIRAQGGSGSGLDVASSHQGGFIRFSRIAPRPTIEPVAWPASVHGLAIWTRETAATLDYIHRFARWHAGQRRASLDALVTSANATANALSDAAAFMRELRAFTARLDEFDRDSGLGVHSVAHRRVANLAGDAVVYKP